MGLTSLDITNSLFTHRAKIINYIDFDSEKFSIIKTKKNKIHVYYNTIYIYYLLFMIIYIYYFTYFIII